MDEDDSDDDDINDTCMRTISSFVNANDKITNNILNFMTHASKNIYNAAVFHTNVFLRYQNLIFKKLLALVNNGTILDITSFDITFYDLYDQYYQRYLRIKHILYTNNQIIYNVIRKYLEESNIIIMNNNFYEVKQSVINIIDTQRLIIVPDKKELYLDIVSDILISMYKRSFNYLKDCIMNNRPCTNFDPAFIDQVKNDEHLFPPNTKVSYKSLLMQHILFKPEKKKKNSSKKNKDTPKEKKKETIKSNQNYIARIIYIYYTNCILPSDLKCNIIAKVYSSFSSYFSLLASGKKANKPKFLDQDGHFILPYFKRSRRLITKNGKQYYKLTIGNYIAERYSAITDSNKFVCLNPNSKIFKKYVDTKYLIAYNKKQNPKKDFFVIGNKCIKKDSTKIFEANYLYIEKPNNLNDDELKLIEINPLYNGTRFKINFTYKTDTTQNTPIQNKVISIDPGMKNLFTIYDPRGEQFIIKGSYINNLNTYYGNKIDEHKKELATYNSKNKKIERKNKTLPKESRKPLLNNYDKCDKTKSDAMIKHFTEGTPFPNFPKQSNANIQRSTNYRCNMVKQIESGKNVSEFETLTTSKKLHKLYLDRNNKIDNYFNHVCNWILNKYSDCETIIIGNNVGWKTKCNMGRKNNRRFYEIPYRKLFNKLTHKANQNNQHVCIINESYTSKCDALALEEICYHKEYLGSRSKRGLFASSTNKYINADLNGAINIMRKWYTKNDMKMKKIRGENIYNPKCVSFSEIMKHK